MSTKVFEAALAAAIAAGAAEAEVRAAWTAGEAVSIPIGRRWHVLRVIEPVGRHAVQVLRARRALRGPVLHVPARGAIEFAVPPIETTDVGALVGARHARRFRRFSRWASTGEMRWPAPTVNTYSGRSARCGRSWIVAPHLAVHTPIDVLSEVFADILAGTGPDEVHWGTDCSAYGCTACSI